ncbi:hypothetical protein PSU4_01240 [Pseudonocardia sulfidoxydans NBRC 16205]|uniref:Integral membrane protein n=3 Tax=Pseudonocardia sulfidoxydans TaxID=54011 RepID=A0A511D8P4_9PSEU|nr:hypothetical protein [Pseudonocardia sulfidoxydans]GEL21170.1 hypothetical protein PSU4_01240 [Pseudonocardia sulfidoxydans NBRC 16205]
MPVVDSPDSSSAAAALTIDERAELERLRTELATLRSTPPPPAPPRAPTRWASVASAVLLVLGLLLVPVSVLSVWAHNQLSDTERFVATTSPILADPAVRSTLADRVTAEIFAQVDVQGLANEAVDALAAQGVPAGVVDRLHGLTGPLADGTRTFVGDKVDELVASPAFVAAGERALAVTHQQIAAALAGNPSALTVAGGETVLDLYPFIEAAKQQLVASGFSLAARLPEIHPTVALFPASTLVRAQSLYTVLDVAATWLPWVTLVLLIAGVMLAKRRRRATLVVGLAVMATMLVLAAALLAVRGIVVGAAAPQSAAAAASTFDIVVRFVRAALRTLFVVGLVVALAAWVTRPSATAVRLRGTVGGGIARMRRGGFARTVGSGPVGPWVHDHRVALRTALVVLAALVVVLWDRPSGWTVLGVVLVLLVLLGVVELLDQPSPATTGSGDGRSGDGESGNDGDPPRVLAATVAADATPPGPEEGPS